MVLYFSDSFHKNVDFLIEQFQDRDWIGIPHETFVIVLVLYVSDSFHKGSGLSGSLVLYVCKVSVGSVRKVLLVLTQSHYVV